MTTHSKAVFKLLDMNPDSVKIDGSRYHIIPVERFSKEEIEELREHDAAELYFWGEHVYANFLPDDVRPANVKKL